MAMVPSNEFTVVSAASFISIPNTSYFLTPRQIHVHSTTFSSPLSLQTISRHTGIACILGSGGERSRNNNGSERSVGNKNLLGNRRTTTTATTTELFAFPQIPWLSFPNKENENSNKTPDNHYDNLNEFGELIGVGGGGGDRTQKRRQSRQQQPNNNNNNDNNNLTNEAETTMNRAVKMMEEHRRSQEAADRTSAIMEELASITVVGRSKAGTSSGGGGIGILGFGDEDAKNRGGGVKVIFNGQQRPVSVNVDSKYLSSLMMMSASASPSSTKSSPSSTTTTTSTTVTTTTSATEELNQAIIDAMQDGYEKSGKIMEEKLKVLYDQLGLPKRE